MLIIPILIPERQRYSQGPSSRAEYSLAVCFGTVYGSCTHLHVLQYRLQITLLQVGKYNPQPLDQQDK